MVPSQRQFSPTSGRCLWELPARLPPELESDVVGLYLGHVKSERHQPLLPRQHSIGYLLASQQLVLVLCHNHGNTITSEYHGRVRSKSKASKALTSQTAQVITYLADHFSTSVEHASPRCLSKHFIVVQQDVAEEGRSNHTSCKRKYIIC